MPIAPGIGVDETDGADAPQDVVPASTDVAVQAVSIGNSAHPAQ
jgi:hypothetical protein